VHGVGSIFSTKAKYELVTIVEKATGKEHHLMYNTGHVPCDECILQLISGAYDVPVSKLLVVDKRPCARDVGCCKNKGKRGTWSLKRLTKLAARTIFRNKSKELTDN